MDKKVRVRFAPSPTGPLHIGGVRTALYNYLFAKHTSGEFLLRIEDTDQPRTVPGAENYIVESLKWCGIDFDYGPHIGGPDAPYRQSDRMNIYRQYADTLIQNGNAYYAFDSEEDIDQMRKKLELAGNKAPSYNQITRSSMKNSLTLPADEVKRKLDEGAEYVIRMKIPRKEEVRFQDAIRGWVVVHSSQLDDKVLLKSDGMPTYHLANVVDDFLMKITHVIRGEEWLPSAPLHVLLYKAFGWESPIFAHLPLILRPDGKGKLSKRDGDQLGFPVFPINWKHPLTGDTASGFKEAGYLPDAFINFLALLGWNPGTNEEIMGMDRLIELFTLERVGSSGTRFDIKKAQWFNSLYIQKQSPEFLISQLKNDLTQHQLPIPQDAYLEQVIHLLKDRVVFLSDFYQLGTYFFIENIDYDSDTVKKKWTSEAGLFLKDFMELLKKSTNWDTHTLENQFKELAEQKNIPTGKIMPSLRLALTGQITGPSLFEIMQTLGKESTINRITNAINTFK